MSAIRSRFHPLLSADRDPGLDNEEEIVSNGGKVSANGKESLRPRWGSTAGVLSICLLSRAGVPPVFEAEYELKAGASGVLLAGGTPRYF